MKHLISPDNFNIEETQEILDLAKDIMQNPAVYSNSCRGKILATLFFEPSTRTRLSFESAMYSLGGNVIGFSEAGNTSASKGESLEDTIKTVSKYSDIIAMRHPKEGSALVASRVAEVPTINAGDGGHQHPTQTFTDLLTIVMEKGRLDNLTIGFCGDLKFGRTIHSLIKAMMRYENVKFVLVSPEELKLPSYIIDELKKKNIEFEEVTTLEENMNKMDILYMTRVQKERFFNEEDYIKLKDTYILNKEKLKDVREDLIIMHPLPRVNEISKDTDSDSRAIYFNQVAYGKYVRMALMLRMLEIA